MQTKKIKFEISIEEANLIFKALSKMPFSEVFELIGRLNEQANQQLKDIDNSNNHHGTS